MKPSIHLIASVILAAMLYPVFDWKVMFILAGGILIDIDHYFWYIFKYKKLSLIKCYKFYIERFDREKVKDIFGLLLIFHTIEFLIIVVSLSFFFESMLVFLIGSLFHYILDMIYLYLVPKQFIANHSVIYWIVKNKNPQNLNNRILD